MWAPPRPAPLPPWPLPALSAASRAVAALSSPLTHERGGIQLPAAFERAEAFNTTSVAFGPELAGHGDGRDGGLALMRPQPALTYAEALAGAKNEVDERSGIDGRLKGDADNMEGKYREASPDISQQKSLEQPQEVSEKKSPAQSPRWPTEVSEGSAEQAETDGMQEEPQEEASLKPIYPVCHTPFFPIITPQFFPGRMGSHSSYKRRPPTRRCARLRLRRLQR